MSVYTTEITSETIPSDNPIHQRLLKAYILAKPLVKGSVLELGCGEGRGLDMLAPKADSYVALDKIGQVLERLKKKYPNVTFLQADIPPLPMFEEDQFDTIISFQVIEHIKKDREFLKEIYRVLKPGGQAIITTPNKKMSLSRNPWHIREYTRNELESLAQSIFKSVDFKGIAGNEKVMQYHERNKASVKKIMRWDFLNLQYRLPGFMLRYPFEVLNRMNRKKLHNTPDALSASITGEDYLLTEGNDQSLDWFVILKK